jgi:hypothetical protein
MTAVDKLKWVLFDAVTLDEKQRRLVQLSVRVGVYARAFPCRAQDAKRMLATIRQAQIELAMRSPLSVRLSEIVPSFHGGSVMKESIIYKEK